MTLDFRPAKTVIGKIVRGLHWYVTGEIIAPTIAPEIYPAFGYSAPGPILKIMSEFGKCIQRCGNQFEAIHAVTQDGVPANSLWLFRFYGQDCFCAALRPRTTCNTEDLPAINQT